MQRWSRREFTRNAAMATLFAPFVKLFVPGEAMAQAAPGQAKYLLIMMTNGTFPDVWRPRAGSGEGTINHGPMTMPLSAIANDGLILIDGLNGNGTMGQHAQTGGLSGSDKGYDRDVSSVDFVVARSLQARNIRTQVPIVHMGGVPTERNSLYIDGGRMTNPVSSPTTAFNTIFGGAAAPLPAANGPAAPNAPSPLLAQLAERQGILSALRDEIRQLNSELRGLEREKLEIHVASLGQLEERLRLQREAAGAAPGGADSGGGGAVTAVQCTPGGRPADSSSGNKDLDNSAAMLPLAVQGFACDLTRVAMVEFGNHQSTQVDLPGEGIRGDWHNGFIHGEGGNGRSLPILEAWLSGRFVDTVQRLKATPAPDGNGTLLEQTLFIWGRNMGDSLAHNDTANVRFVIAGRAGGYLRHANGGRYINAGGSAGHVQVLTAVAEAMGVTDFAALGKGNPTAKTPLAALKA